MHLRFNCGCLVGVWYVLGNASFANILVRIHQVISYHACTPMIALLTLGLIRGTTKFEECS